MHRTSAAALAIFILALAIYGATLCPTVFVGDSGELAAAATTLGIAHPPGFPLWTTLGRGAVALAPGAPAVALNLLSALCTAAAAGLLAALLAMLSGRIVVSAGVALAFALSRGVWSQAIITEVYGLNLLMTVSALTAAVAAHGGRPRLFLLAGYLLGLGTANHPFVLLAGLPVAGLVLLPREEAQEPVSDRARRFLPMAGLFLLGLSAYLYLPLRWTADPPVMWGGPRALGDFLDHVMRAQYGGLGEATADTSLGLRLRVFGEILYEGTAIPILIGAAVGVVLLLRKVLSKPDAVALLLLVLAGPVTAGVIRYEDTFLDRSVASVYFLTAVLSVFMLAGVGIAGIDRLVNDRLTGQGRAGVVFSGAVACLLPIALAFRNAKTCDRSEATLPRAYAEEVFRELPPDALIFPLGDNELFIFTYFQAAEGLRPDVKILDRSLNLGIEAWGQDFYAKTRPERKRDRLLREVELVFAERDRPVFYSDLIDLTEFGGSRLVQNGILFQLLRPGDSRTIIPFDAFAVPPTNADDFLESHLAGTVLLRQADWLIERGDEQGARRRYREAAQRAQKDPLVLRNIGVAYRELQDWPTAERLYRWILERFPDHEASLRDLAGLYDSLGEDEQALEIFDRMIGLGYGSPEVHLDRGVLLVRLGRLEKARPSPQPRALSRWPRTSSRPGSSPPRCDGESNSGGRPAKPRRSGPSERSRWKEPCCSRSGIWGKESWSGPRGSTGRP
jgi:tetratricopeptide (TPR) repeat protein